MKLATSLLLFVVFSYVYAQAPTQYVQSFTVSGFDVIFANDTSFLDTIDRHRGTLYVAGEGWIHQVNEMYTFNITYWSWFNQRHSFLDFKVFFDNMNNSYAVGPITNQYNNNTYGMNYPFQLLGRMVGNHVNQNISVIEPPPGNYLMASVALDVDNNQRQVAYFSGWHQHWNATEGVNFTVIRTVVNTAAQAGPVFQYNHTGGDRIYLHGEGFVAFDRVFKPWMFHNATKAWLIVVDPASNSVYRVTAPNDETVPMSFDPTDPTMRYRHQGGPIVSATYDPLNHVVYLGVMGWGTTAGSIVEVHVDTMVSTIHPLQIMESNPRSLSLDYQGHLYVGLFGGHAILKIDLYSWTTVGYNTLPFFLRNVQAVSAQREHVYFITNEQHSKVARTSNNNFCATPCDGFVGYCNAGACACPSNMQLAADKMHCNIPSTEQIEKLEKKEHGGEVALGILFALSFIAAALGWFIIWRSRKGSLLETVGLLHNR